MKKEGDLFESSLSRKFDFIMDRTVQGGTVPGYDSSVVRSQCGTVLGGMVPAPLPCGHL